jgi:hypothetical protein
MMFRWNECLLGLKTRELLNIDLSDIVQEKLLDRVTGPFHA